MKQQEVHSMKKRFNISGRMRWLLIGIVILAIAGGAAFYYVRSTKASATTTTVKPLQTATAFRGNITLSANGTGSLAPSNKASFGFGTSGQITELDVKIADTVTAGQVIGKLDDKEAQAAYQQAKRNLDDLTTPASIAAAEQSVADAEVSVTNALNDLKHLISPDVYFWELKVTEAQTALKTAQDASGSNPTTDQQN